MGSVLHVQKVEHVILDEKMQRVWGYEGYEPPRDLERRSLELTHGNVATHNLARVKFNEGHLFPPPNKNASSSL